MFGKICSNRTITPKQNPNMIWVLFLKKDDKKTENML